MDIFALAISPQGRFATGQLATRYFAFFERDNSRLLVANLPVPGREITGNRFAFSPIFGVFNTINFVENLEKPRLNREKKQIYTYLWLHLRIASTVVGADLVTASVI